MKNIIVRYRILHPALWNGERKKKEGKYSLKLLDSLVSSRYSLRNPFVSNICRHLVLRIIVIVVVIPSWHLGWFRCAN